MIRGEGTAIARGVAPQEVFDFVLDPAQYTKADTKMVWVTKLGDTADGMIAREDGRFLGKFPGSVITRYRWAAPHRIDVTLEHGVPQHLHAWFEIDEIDGGTRIHHVEEMDFGRGPLGWLYERIGGRWFSDSVDQEVDEIARCSKRASVDKASRRTTASESAAVAVRVRSLAPAAPASPSPCCPCLPACSGTSSRCLPTGSRGLSRLCVAARAWCAYSSPASALRALLRVARSVAWDITGAEPIRLKPPIRGTVIVR
jgi:hypothetical protein